jgi:hypothetical protein
MTKPDTTSAHALDFWGTVTGLYYVISTHNSYYRWSAARTDADTVHL